MKTLAFLQNAWFRDPASVQRIYDAHAGDLDRLAKLERRFLFAGCLTGRRLKGAFGAMVDQITWANASPVIAGKASAKPPADLVHMRKLIDHHQPGLVIAFGRPAAEALYQLKEEAALHGEQILPHTIVAPHPAARAADTPAKLRETARLVRAQIELLEARQ